MKSSFILIPLVAVALWACATDEPRDGDDDEGDGGAGSGSTAMSSGSASSSTGGGVVSATCAALCERLAPICSGDDDTVCGATCQMREDGPCSAEWSAVEACLADPGTTLECKNEKPTSDGCLMTALAFAACDENGGSTGLCYANQGECNPMIDSCGPGGTCDVAFGESFKCYPPPNDVPVGGSCANPPYCVSGAFCYVEAGICKKYCCTDADCDPGQKCLEYDFGPTNMIKIMGCVGL